jgi:superfamily II DNA helicase RecQ
MAKQKKELLRTWLAFSGQPYIVAIFTLSAGFDYTYIRLVIHINKPLSLIDFAQESSRAGRDGKKAYSLVLLSPTWKLQVIKNTAVKRRALYYYLLDQDYR